MISKWIEDWINNDFEIAKVGINQFLIEKEYKLYIRHLNEDTKLTIIPKSITPQYDIIIKKNLNNTPEQTLKNFLIAILESSTDIEDEFIEWITPEFLKQEHSIEDVPIDKFDAVCAQELTKKATDLMKKQ